MGYWVLIVFILCVTVHKILKLYYSNRPPKCEHDWGNGFRTDYKNDNGAVWKRTITYTCHKCKEVKTNKIG